MISDNLNKPNDIILEAYNLLDNFAGAVQVNQTLVNAHFIGIPSLGTFTVRGFAGRLYN